MALVVKDRVRETTTTTGTGSVSLAGPVTGFQSFSVIGDTNTTYYAIVDAATGEWEVGIGTYTLSGTTLSRDTVLESSNSGALVPFIAGTKDVFCTYPAETSVSDGKTNVIQVSSTDAALRITQTGGGDALLVEDVTNPDGSPFVIDATGQLIRGYPSVLPTVSNTGAASTPSLQSMGNGQGASSVGLFNWSDATSGPYLNFSKSKSGILGTHAAVVADDDLGSIVFAGSDDAAFDSAAFILSEVDGTVASGSVPGRLTFATTAVGGTSPTERMRIDSSGNINIATTGARITGDFSNGTIGNRVFFQSSTTNGNTIVGFLPNGTATTGRLNVFNSSSTTNYVVGSLLASSSRVIVSSEAAGSATELPLTFDTAGSERMRIRSDGNIGIGGEGAASVNFYNQANITGGTTAYGNYTVSSIQSDVTSVAYGNRTALTTAAASFTLGTLNHYAATQTALGAGSTVTNQYGFHAESSLNDAINNYGFFSNIAAATGDWNFYANGTATNYFAGSVGIGTDSPDIKLDVVGGTTSGAVDDTLLLQGGVAGVAGSGAALYLSGGGGVARSVEIAGINTNGAGNAHAMTFSTSASTAAPTERMRIDSAGNVGIGTTAPASRLHVSNAGDVADNCFNVSTPANDNVLLGANLVVDAAGTYTKPATSLSGAGILFAGINNLNAYGTISFLSAPDTNTGSATPITQMIIDADGNVGLKNAVTAPIAPLHIGLNEPGGEAIRLSWNTGSTTQAEASIGFGRSLDAVYPNAAIAGQETDTSDLRGNLLFYTRDTDTDVAPTERVRITNTGNVGIGTTAPGALLDVTASNNGLTSITANNALRFTDADITTAANQPIGVIEFYTSDTSAGGTGVSAYILSAAAGTSGGGDLRFGTAGNTSSGSPAERLRIVAADGTLTSQPTYDNTAAGSTVVVTSAGLIRRTSSSLKYKKDVETLDYSLASNAIENLRPVWYRTKTAAGDDKETWSHIGLIAEEVHEIEPRLVRYRTVEVNTDEFGERVETPLEVPEPEDVDYGRLAVLLLAEVKTMKNEISTLKAEIAALKGV
jgi:hypothetical protein